MYDAEGFVDVVVDAPAQRLSFDALVKRFMGTRMDT
jgi:hypothetical protein